jgi:hypothetical protein
MKKVGKGHDARAHDAAWLRFRLRVEMESHADHCPARWSGCVCGIREMWAPFDREVLEESTTDKGNYRRKP